MNTHLLRSQTAAGLMLCLVCSLPGGAAAKSAAKSAAEVARGAAKVKAGLTKLGAGEHVRVEVRLRDQTKLKGYVRELGADDFVVVVEGAGAATRVAYPQVQKVKGKNRLSGDTILAGFGIAAFISLFVAVIIGGGDF